MQETEIVKIVTDAATTATVFIAAEVAVFASVCIAGFVCGIARALCTGNFRNLLHLFCIGVCSGGLAFAVVTIFFVSSIDDGRFDYRLVGIATFIGLVGQEFEKPLFKIVFHALMIPFDKLGLLKETAENELPN